MKRKILRILLLLALVLCQKAPAQGFIDWNASWAYFKGTAEPSVPNTLWREAGFDVSGWATGNAPFRYGDGTGGTLLDDMAGTYSSMYLRKEFTVTDADSVDELRISVDYDDGFVLWINGELILDVNAPAGYPYDGFAPANHESGEWVTFVVAKENFLLVEGTNVIAVQGFNVSNTSSDFFLDLKAEGIHLLPETEQVFCDTPGGFCSGLFIAKLYGTANGDTIKYTLDGSDPRTSSSALSDVSPVSVTINPNSTNGGRGKTGGVVLRASKFKTGFAPGRPVTSNYIFTDAVIDQVHPGGSWPTTNINSQHIDLVMDANITHDARFGEYMDDALMDIPSICIATDPASLFDPQTGIYVNAKYHGRTWERPANIELINPDGSEGFNIDAGLRIRGGWSRHPEFAKHAFRLFFRSEYGEGKLDFPLFGDEGVDEFDKVDLRTSQNYSWSKGGGEGVHNTMNRDVFSRDCQRDMNQPYTRSRYYHLYLNGLYWGVFQTQERPDADFAESYFGGSDEDYDIVKVDIGEEWNIYEIEATDGTTDAWESVWNMCQAGFASNLNYFKLTGCSLTGEADTSLNVWVDIDNLIDYMLVIFYAGNFDAPVSKFSGNYNPNNFFAIYDRARKREGFKFFAHDAEHTLLTDPVSPGIGLNENRVNIGNISSQQMNVTYFGKFQPQWLHHKLTANQEYRLHFADRVYRHFFNGGVFDPDSCIKRFRYTSDQLDMAIIAESARWGDVGVWPARNRVDDWIPAVNRVVNNYMPYRTGIVLNQLIDENLYMTLQPPLFKKNGIEITNYTMILSSAYDFSVTNPNSGGTIYFTTDGTDPRAVGGAVSGSAEDGGSSKNISVLPGAHIKARIKDGTVWSALHEMFFLDAHLFNNLKVTELYYHPPDYGAIEGKEFEFIELKNTGTTTTLDLSGLTFSGGVRFTFPEGSTLAPQSFVVIASNSEMFKLLFGFPPDYQLSGHFSNAGEHVVLNTDTNVEVFSFTYSDDYPWPPEADGDGYSLVSAHINPKGDPNNPDYWTISKYLAGSPLADDERSATGTPGLFFAGKPDFTIFPNPATSVINLVFSQGTPGNVEIGFYDLNGRLIHLLIDEYMASGKHSRTIQLTSLDLKPGMYLIRLKSERVVSTRKLIYNK